MKHTPDMVGKRFFFAGSFQDAQGLFSFSVIGMQQLRFISVEMVVRNTREEEVYLRPTTTTLLKQAGEKIES